MTDHERFSAKDQANVSESPAAGDGRDGYSSSSDDVDDQCCVLLLSIMRSVKSILTWNGEGGFRHIGCDHNEAAAGWWCLKHPGLC